MAKDKILVLGKLNESSNQRLIIYSTESCSPTLQSAMGTGGVNVPLIIDIEEIKECKTM